MTDILKKLPAKKFAVVTAAILVMSLVAVGLWKDSQTYTVAKGEKINGLGATYGYEIENYRYAHGMRITIWTKLGLSTVMKSVYELPKFSIDEVLREDWIKSDGAIFLKLRIIDHSSLDTIHPMLLIYDFNTGEMYVSSDLTLWRIWSRNLSQDDWLNEKEFEEILTELQQ
ncbi:MAG: hypothetical protein JW963_08575 [Anaerolineales bacterium]|nr:hypothetical protein [Anaerolineales bacterium]